MKVKKIIVDKTLHNGKELYRYNIVHDDCNVSIGSCFCFDSLQEAVEEMCYQLEKKWTI